MIIAPDAGRVKLVRKFAQKVGAPYALLEKERPAQQVAEIGYVIGDVKGKVAVIVDDIIDTGGTLERRRADRARRGRARGPRRRHPRRVLRPARSRRSPPRRCRGIVVTDTVPLRRGRARHDHACSPRADILTDSVRRIFTDDSVSEIFQGENQLF